jgi:uncharacterized protein
LTARLAVTVSPRARRSLLLGRHGQGWKASVAAAPERGRANDALVRLLAAALGVPIRSVRVVAGETSRRKTVEIDGLDPDEVDRRLAAASAQPL